MIPKSVSASALKTYQLCPSRYVAEYVTKGKGGGSAPAFLGTAVHSSLQKFVEVVHIGGNDAFNTLAYLHSLFDQYFEEMFPQGDQGGDWYDTGRTLLKDWHARTSFEGREVVSVEVRRQMMIPAAHNGVEIEIPLTYIIDRLDRKGPGVYRVVDYKTQREYWSVEDLEFNIQALIYAISVMIDYPDAEEVWVEMDLLRHSNVGRRFRRSELQDAYRRLLKMVQEIVDLDSDYAQERLNIECVYCVKRLTCNAVRKNVASGGIESLDDDGIIDAQAQMYFQLRAVKANMDDLQPRIMNIALDREETTFDTGWATVEVVMGQNREVDDSKIPAIVGQALFDKHATKAKMGVGALDSLIADPAVSSEQKAQLKQLITMKLKDPSLKIKSKGKL